MAIFPPNVVNYICLSVLYFKKNKINFYFYFVAVYSYERSGFALKFTDITVNFIV